MARQMPDKKVLERVIAFSEWLYRLFLHMYPAPFRRAYGVRMLRVFRDSCRDVLQHYGLPGLISFWLHALFDLGSNALFERWQLLWEEIRAMTTYGNAGRLPGRLWTALVITFLAFLVSLIASVNLFLIEEDSGPLTQAAYSASPLLRFSYDGLYLSALAAGVAVCISIGYVFVKRESLMLPALLIVSLVVAFGGFGGLLRRQPLTFFVLFIVFLLLVLLSVLPGRALAARVSVLRGQRAAAVLGGCISVSLLLLVNVAALIVHTLLLNPVSHALYMAGQIAGTSFNFSLLAMVAAFLTLVVSWLSVGYALR